MPTNNSWLTPYQRSFNAIKQQILARLRVNVPEITDYTEGNILVVIISIFSAIAEVLHYYIDNMARETFFTTARRYSSLYKHAKLVDYHIKAGVPASTDLTLYTQDGKPLGEEIIIPIGTQWTSQDGKIWVNTKSMTWTAPLKLIKVPVVQKYLAKEEVSLGVITYTGIAIELGNIPADQFYVEGSMSLNIDGETWTLVDTFAYSGSLDKVYKVELNDAMVPTIYFGDNINGMTPAVNSKLTGSYYLTYGAGSNISENSFTQVPQEIRSLIPTRVLKIKQELPASGGSNYEGFEALKRRVPLSIKSLGVAITKEDYEAIAMLQDGVLKAYANFMCSRFVQVFIVPDNYGVASNWLIEQVYNKLSASKVITTSVQVYPVYIAKLRFQLEVFGNKSFTSLEIKKQIQDALLEKFSWENAELNNIIKLSDVYALIDNLPVVDYLNIESMYLMTNPYQVVDANTTTSPEVTWKYFNPKVFNLKEALKFRLTVLEDGYRLMMYHSEEMKPYIDQITIVNGANQSKSDESTTADFQFGVQGEIILSINDGATPLLHFQWQLDQPGDDLTYVPGDAYIFYLSTNQGNISTEFDTNGEVKYLPIFVNGPDDLILNIHETL